MSNRKKNKKKDGKKEERAQRDADKTVKKEDKASTSAKKEDEDNKSVREEDEDNKSVHKEDEDSKSAERKSKIDNESAEQEAEAVKVRKHRGSVESKQKRLTYADETQKKPRINHFFKIKRPRTSLRDSNLEDSISRTSITSVISTESTGSRNTLNYQNEDRISIVGSSDEISEKEKRIYPKFKMQRPSTHDYNDEAEQIRLYEAVTDMVFEEVLPDMYDSSDVNLSFWTSSSFDFRAVPNTAKRDSYKIYEHIRGVGCFIYMTLPLDGDYAWFITFISFLCQMVISGIIFTVGILLPSMATDLNISVHVIWLASSQIGLYFLTMPIACAFVNKLGYRIIALMGALLAIVALLSASYCPYAELLVLCSILGGAALAFLYIGSHLIISYYFIKYRSFAHGLTCAGTGAGIMVFSFMSSSLLSSVGWRGVLRTYCILLGLLVFLILFYVNLNATKIYKVEVSEDIEHQRKHFTALGGSINRESKPMVMFKEERLEELFEIYHPPATYSSSISERLMLKPCFATDATDAKLTFEKNVIIRPDPIERIDLLYMGPAEYPVTNMNLLFIEERSTQIVSRSYEARCAWYCLSMLTVRRTYVCGFKWFAFMPRILCALYLLTNRELLIVPKFVLLIHSTFFYALSFNIPFLYSHVRAEIPDANGTLPTIIIGFSILFFSIISGLQASKWPPQTLIIFSARVMCAVGVLLVISSFFGPKIKFLQFTIAFCFGIAPALFSTLWSIEFAYILGIEQLTNAFGLVAITIGVAVFIGTTFSAYVNYYTGSYIITFTFSGLFLIISGVLKIIIITDFRMTENNNL